MDCAGVHVQNFTVKCWWEMFKVRFRLHTWHTDLKWTASSIGVWRVEYDYGITDTLFVDIYSFTQKVRIGKTTFCGASKITAVCFVLFSEMKGWYTTILFGLLNNVL